MYSIGCTFGRDSLGDLVPEGDEQSGADAASHASSFVGAHALPKEYCVDRCLVQNLGHDQGIDGASRTRVKSYC